MSQGTAPAWNPEANEIFLQALEITSLPARAQFLDRACDGRPDVRRAVEALLESSAQAGSFLQHPVIATDLFGAGPSSSDASGLGGVPNGANLPPLTTEAIASEAPGSAIGPYKLLERIGEGGMGLVFMADQERPIKRRVALKIIKPGMDSRQVLARFEAERQALAMMDHQNIARVLDGGATEAGRPYFVMELVHGVPITQYCDLNRLTLRERLELFLPVCQAIQHAHQKGIIHRDIKPSNILVTLYDGQPVPKVIDFGIAKATDQRLTEKTMFTQFGMLVGTFEYMPPEQAEMSALGVDTRSDVYSLGVVLYELLTGTTPLERERLRDAAYDEIVRRIREEEPPPPSTRLSTTKAIASIASQRKSPPSALARLVRGELDWIVMKCLEKDRTQRYPTVSSLATDLLRYLNDEPVEACPPSPLYRMKKFVRKHRGPVLAVSLVVLALIAGVLGTTWGLITSVHARTAESQQRQRAEANEATARAAAESARLAKIAAEEQQSRAETGERLAGERLQQVEVEKQIATAVKDFMLNKLLVQTDTEAQADALLAVGRSSQDAELDPPISVLLDRASAELAPGRIELNFANQPLVQAELLQTIGFTYLKIGRSSDAIAHLKRARDLFIAALGADDPRTLATLGQLGSAYQVAGKLPAAIRILEQVRDAQIRRLGLDHRDTLITLNSLGGAYSAASQLPKAMDAFKRVRDGQVSQLGAGHPDTLTTLNNLAIAYEAAGDSAASIALHEQVRDAQQRQLGPDHPATLLTLNNLAKAYQDAGNFSLAIELFEQARDAQTRKLGPDHPNTLVTLSNLGSAYIAAGRAPEAIELLEQVRDTCIQKRGADHPGTLSTLVNLGSAYFASGRAPEAIELLEQVRNVYERKLGPDHMETLTALNNLATAYLAVGKMDLAIELLERVRDTRTRTLGPDHAHTLTALHNLARAYQETGALPKAIELLERVRDARLQDLGADHPDTLTTINNLALAYQDTGRLPDAIALFEQAATSVERRHYRHEHRDWIIGSTVSAYEAAKQFDHAEAWLRKWLDVVRKESGAESPVYANGLAYLGRNLLQQRKFAQAESTLRECLAIRETQEPDAWTTFHAQSLLGGALLAEQKYDAAESLLLAGYNGMKQRKTDIPAEARFRLAEAVNQLIQLYAETGQREKAEQWEQARDPPGSASDPPGNPED